MIYDIRPTVQRITKIPFERLRVIQKFSDLRPLEIRAGIIFVFAGWSGPSVMALGKFTSTLSQLDLKELEIIILDNDCMTADDMILLSGDVFHGAGEALWMRDGQIVAKESVFRKESESQILFHTRILLSI